LKVLGFEDGPGSCFAFQVGKCKGACAGKEPLLVHRLRAHMALAALKLKAWPFPGRVAIQEGHAEYHVLDHWRYLGTARSDEELQELAGRKAGVQFDADVYRIVMRHLAKHPDARWHDLSKHGIVA
jgi:DNA polymerase-3 subunit epsilon